MTCQNSHVRFYVSLIVPGEGRHATHLLTCVRLLSASETDWTRSSDILSDISFVILSDISPGLLSDISSDILSHALSGISPDILCDILSDVFLFFPTYLLTFFLKYLLTFFPRRGWGPPARNTELTWSQLTSTEHWAHTIAVEVRHGTPNSHDRGGGPARVHWTHMIAVEVRHGTLSSIAVEGRQGTLSSIAVEVRQGTLSSIAVEVRQGTLSSHHRGWRRGGEEEEEKQADTKSNNPHLTGGEKPTTYSELEAFPWRRPRPRATCPRHLWR